MVKRMFKGSFGLIAYKNCMRCGKTFGTLLPTESFCQPCKKIISKLWKLSEKYPDTSVIKKKWVKKDHVSYAGSRWHWKLTPSGEKALRR